MVWLKRIALMAVWGFSLLAAGLWGRAQAAENKPSVFPLFSGADFGFRVDHMKVDASGQLDGTPTGTFVVRINGLWYEARQSGGQ